MLKEYYEEQIQIKSEEVEEKKYVLFLYLLSE